MRDEVMRWIRNLKYSPVFTEIIIDGEERTARLIPGAVSGEGHFIGNDEALEMALDMKETRTLKVKATVNVIQGAGYRRPAEQKDMEFIRAHERELWVHWVGCSMRYEVRNPFCG